MAVFLSLGMSLDCKDKNTKNHMRGNTPVQYTYYRIWYAEILKQHYKLTGVALRAFYLDEMLSDIYLNCNLQRK